MTDVELRQTVSDALEFEPSINAAHVGVAAKDGVVTLSGHVATYAEKLKAEEVAMGVRGVKAIAEEIEVRPAGTHATADDEIARRVLEVLRWNTTVPDDRVKVTVQNGWVTLTGSVEWNYQRESASRALQGLAGVRGVANTIRIAPKASPADLRNRIEQALKRQTELDALGIAVELADGSVTLRGKVHSLSERRVAEQAVWAAPGVREVRDNLSVM
ncbi:BON domain-containing protein [Rhodobacteraceae bacterium HSP-20]|uniref:BON domain-containing protein n=1 Tax=Paragemmobacter amnigenus TaxID=2852097 RepID=A0ABS6IZ30_9RHOB|nr:BON domain-containing protein [Rhodobacter amnigenus]MBU9696603.1 BON domain-containing protein [Rhodobacter amnigenus]MBV4387830.1 BON domain-containing protein [Rhodobacter amnigenus]